jgi:hypothetical protein
MSDEHLSQSSMLDDMEAAPVNRIEPAVNPPAVHKRKHANELDGKTWTRYSISIWSDLSKTPEEIELGHPAMFPLAVVARLIEMFTNRPGAGVLCWMGWDEQQAFAGALAPRETVLPQPVRLINTPTSDLAQIIGFPALPKEQADASSQRSKRPN